MATPRRSLVAVFAQLLTHPLVWFLFPLLPRVSGATAFTAAELWAWLVEAAFYATVLPDISPARALGTSAVANAASLLAGVVVF